MSFRFAPIPQDVAAAYQNRGGGVTIDAPGVYIELQEHPSQGMLIRQAEWIANRLDLVLDWTRDKRVDKSAPRKPGSGTRYRHGVQLED